MIRNDWLHELYDALGVPHSLHNARAGIAWMQTEGGDARWNPLNTTKRMSGSTDFNNIGVQNYPDFKTGLEATVQTLAESGHGYERILKRLRRNAYPRRTCTAITESSWGTGDLIFDVLGDIVKRNKYWDYANTRVAGSA